MSLYDTRAIDKVKVVMMKGETGGGGGGASALTELSDVNISSPTNGQVLKYNSTTQEWVNSTDSGLPENPLAIAHGGTGNAYGYIRTGAASGSTIGTAATVEGSSNTASGDYSHAEGSTNEASGECSHVEGMDCYAEGDYSHAEGVASCASGETSHAEGGASQATGRFSHAEGTYYNCATGNPDDDYTTASGEGSHAEGAACHATGYYAHAEGLRTISSGGNGSHSEGYWTTASGNNAHSEGYKTTASNSCTHAGGTNAVASGLHSFAHGQYVNAGYAQQSVLGRYNDNKSTSLFEIGNGADANNRSNAFEVDASGNVTASGDVTDGAGNVLAEVSSLEITQSGNPVTVNAVGIKAKDVVVTLDPIQDLHGYGKPWIGGTGKNKLPMTVASVKAANTGGTWSGNVYSINNVTIEILTDETNTNVLGFNVNTGSGGASAQIIFSLGNTPTSGNYILNGCPSGGDADNGYSIYVTGIYKHDTGNGVNITLSGTAYNTGILIRSGTSASNKVFYPMIRLSTESDATFAPYSNICPISGRTQTSVTTRNEDNTESHTATISFGQTVYGGQVDFKTGVGIVDKAIIDTGNMSWSYNSSTGAMDSSISDIKRPISDNEAVNAICSVAKTIPASERGSSTSMDFYAFYNNNTVCVRRSGYTDAIAFTTAMTGQTICYELATPITIQLTPAMLELLKGYNYITADGNMEITLIPESIFDEAKAYTDSALADKTDNGVVGPVESGTTASKAYAVGEHFIRNDKFCTAIAAIASGAALTLNTNYVEGTIAENITKRVNYSTTEHVVGTWIDGSTIYEKTIDFGAMPNSTTKSVDAGLPSGAKVINVFGFCTDSSWTSVFPLPFADATTGGNYNFQLGYSNGNVQVKTATYQSHYTISYVTLQYIKSS